MGIFVYMGEAQPKSIAFGDGFAHYEGVLCATYRIISYRIIPYHIGLNTYTVKMGIFWVEA